MKVHGNKKVNGITTKTGGKLELFDGFKLLREAVYKNRSSRMEKIEQWKNDIKSLHPDSSFYFVITPNL